MRTIVCTTGTSIATGVERARDEKGQEQQFREAVRKRLETLRGQEDSQEAFLIRASAETNSLVRLKASKEDHVVLLHTETDDGRWCAEEVQRLLEQTLGVRAQLVRVEGLQVTDERRFRREGIQNLFKQIDQCCKHHPKSEIILNITGGFKSVVPYLTLYGLLKRIPVVYIFERSNALLHLPPAPVNFDYERLGQARDALAKLQQEEVMQKEDFFRAIPGLAYNERDWYESLLEEDQEGYVTLSAFGMLMADQLPQEQGQVYLSPRAKKAYEESGSVIKDQFTFLLERLKERCWRRAHVHSFLGTDLRVYKPGNTSCRAACVLQGSRVYVCELYQHDEYERDLPKRKRADYDLKQFEPWSPPADAPPAPETEEDLMRQLTERCTEAEEARKKAETEWEESEQRREEVEKEAERLRQQLGQCREKLAELERQLSDLEQLSARLQKELAWARRPWWRKLLGLPPVTKGDADT